MSTWLLLGAALAGGLGAGARYTADTLITSRTRGDFPWGTALINASGSFLFGLVMGVWLQTYSKSAAVICVLLIGGLGGFTTFSTATFEAVRLIQRGETVKAATYALGWLVVCVIAAFAGLAVTVLLDASPSLP